MYLKFPVPRGGTELALDSIEENEEGVHLSIEEDENSIEINAKPLTFLFNPLAPRHSPLAAPP